MIRGFNVSVVLVLCVLAGCGGCGRGGDGSGNVPLKRANWRQPLSYSDINKMPQGDLWGFRIYIDNDNTFTENDLYADSVDTSSVLKGVDNSTGVTILVCEYDLRKSYDKNHLNLTDNFYVAIRSVTVNGDVSGFSYLNRPFSFSEK